MMNGNFGGFCGGEKRHFSIQVRAFMLFSGESSPLRFHFSLSFSNTNHFHYNLKKFNEINDFNLSQGKLSQAIILSQNALINVFGGGVVVFLFLREIINAKI